MVATWSDSDPFSSDGEPKVKVKGNICLMVKDNEICNDELDDYDNL